MSVQELETQVRRLSAHELRDFVQWLDAHRDELLTHSADLTASPPAGEDIAAAQRAEVSRRLAELEVNPSLLVPFEAEDFDQMIESFTGARPQKASSRQG